VAQSRYLEANAHLRETIDLFEQLGQRDELAQAMAWLVYAQVGLGHLDEARSLLLRSLRLGVEIGSALPLMEALPALAIYYAKQGNGYRAIQTFALALRYPLVANCPVFEDLAGKHISSYSLSLEPQIVEAAQLQGHVGDVMTTVHELMSELEVLPD